MNRSECRALLTREGVPEEYFDLNGGRNSETFTIGETLHGTWYYYYFERGHEVGRRDFKSEGEACEHLVKVIRQARAISPWPSRS